MIFGDLQTTNDNRHTPASNFLCVHESVRLLSENAILRAILLAECIAKERLSSMVFQSFMRWIKS